MHGISHDTAVVPLFTGTAVPSYKCPMKLFRRPLALVVMQQLWKEPCSFFFEKKPGGNSPEKTTPGENRVSRTELSFSYKKVPPGRQTKGSSSRAEKVVRVGGNQPHGEKQRGFTVYVRVFVVSSLFSAISVGSVKGLPLFRLLTPPDSSSIVVVLSQW